MTAPNPATKLPKVGTTIFTVMSQLAIEHKAVNLGQGFPDFPVPSRLVDELDNAMRAGHNQYAPMSGIPALRTAIAAKTERCYGWRRMPMPKSRSPPAHPRRSSMPWPPSCARARR
jgi:methionine aminotransferase